MYRCYRRPGIARPVDDLFACRTERHNVVRVSPRARKERLSRLITHLIARHEPDEIDSLADDRRFALRQPADERPFEAFAADNEAHVVWLEDVSRTGMRFRSQYPFACGCEVTFCAPPSFSLEPVRIRVIRTQMVDPFMTERGFEFGAEFDDHDQLPHAWYLATRARR